MNLRIEIERLVGPLSARERGILLGRESAIRKAAAAGRGVDRFLPPPPIEQDLTIGRAAGDVDGGVRQYGGKRRELYQGRAKSARKAKAGEAST